MPKLPSLWELNSRNADWVSFTGGNVGLMEVLADAVLAGGGEVIGVIPEKLKGRELAHEGCSELHVVDTMHSRKALMLELGDAYIALPGGIGTLEEISEAYTWAQLGYHKAPVGLLDVDGYWEPLLKILDHFVAEGFLRTAQRNILQVSDNPSGLLDIFESYQPPATEKWIDRANLI